MQPSGEDYLGRVLTTFTDVPLVFDWTSRRWMRMKAWDGSHLESSAGNVFLLDNVSVTVDAQVPEPATLTLLGLGLAALGGRARRRR